MFLTKLLTLPLSLILAVNAAGIDMDYEGEVDMVTQEPINSTDEEENEDQSENVSVSDGVTFNYEQNMYSYTVPDSGGLTVSASVANRMITTSEVSINVSNGVTAALYLDGEPVDEAEFGSIGWVGSYSLVVTTEGNETQLFTFTIVPEKTGMISSYQLPDGFDIVEVALNDEVQNVSEKKIISMKKEGMYLISYRCRATGVEYALRVEIDHTPPAVKLEGVEDGKAKQAVTVTGIEEGDSVSMTKDGNEYKLPLSGVIKMPGKYTISVTDDAGNTVKEEFDIKFYLDRQGLWFGLIAAAVIISAISYMVMARKKLRVR